MSTLIRNGGIGMLFVLLFGAVALLAGFYFAVRAERRTLGFVKDMSRATLFATLACTSADIGATLYHSAEVMAAGEPYVLHGERIAPSAMIVEGLAESTSPGILGFSFLGMTAMLTAVGRRRMAERAAT
ncbi:MAG TPA: hypothetical protein VIF62_17695 [Labilithrix sp.]|jgi:hypothetical protein